MERKRYLLRVDPRLYSVLERWAADELRSVNAQIEQLLTDSARRAGRWPPPRARADAAKDGPVGEDDRPGRPRA